MLELMATLTVAAVILAFGVPSFLSVIQNSRATTYTNEVVTALNLARTEASRRNANVVVCRSVNGTVCANGTDWSVGWVVRTAGGELIRSWPAQAGGANLITGPAAGVTYQPRGTAAAIAAFQIRLPNCTGDQGRDITVNRPGRVAVSRVNC